MVNGGNYIYQTIKDVNITGKRLLIRVDMNVPLQNGTVSDNTRIVAALPTLYYALQNKAALILMTHLGRPKEGSYSVNDDVRPIAQALSKLFGQEVKVIDHWQDQGVAIQPGEIVMLQNVRFNVGENADDESLGRAYASLCDIFVNDAFATAHRAQASTEAVAKFAPQAVCGLLLDEELRQLNKVLTNPEKPLLAIVGGSKVSSKLQVLETLADKVDQLIVGGGIANTFLLAKHCKIGCSLAEKGLIKDAQRVIAKLAARGAKLLLPQDVHVAKSLSTSAIATLKSVDEVADDDLILDFGPQTMRQISKLIHAAKTVVWNGPIGVFELSAFAEGTKELAQAIAKSEAFSIAGGGDTLAAMTVFHVKNEIDYISTGGGAFLEFLAGKSLPAVQVLSK